MRGETGFEPLLEFGNQLVEIGHGVRGKRGHSHESILRPEDGRSIRTGPAGPSLIWQTIPFQTRSSQRHPGFLCGLDAKM